MKPIACIAVASLALLSLSSALVQDSKPAGKVTGRVVYDGKPPETVALPIAADKSKGCCPEGQSVSTKDPTLLIDSKGAIGNCVVTVQVEGAKAQPLAKPLEIDQKGCHFEPHVSVATVGSKLVFLNSDQCTHNVHTYARKSEGMNKALSTGGKLEMALEHKEVIQVRCDYHPWMSCEIVVVDTPYYAITKEDGTFEIPGLAPGTYKAEVWHEQIGRTKLDVTVGPDGNAALGDVKISFKKKT
jgi:plastocyanin